MSNTFIRYFLGFALLLVLVHGARVGFSQADAAPQPSAGVELYHPDHPDVTVVTRCTPMLPMYDDEAGLRWSYEFYNDGTMAIIVPRHCWEA